MTTQLELICWPQMCFVVKVIVYAKIFNLKLHFQVLSLLGNHKTYEAKSDSMKPPFESQFFIMKNTSVHVRAACLFHSYFYRNGEI